MNTQNTNTGVVKFFNEDKGYGFIIDDEKSTEYFVHVSGTKSRIHENDKVSYTLEQGKKGMNAVNVQLI